MWSFITLKNIIIIIIIIILTIIFIYLYKKISYGNPYNYEKKSIIKPLSNDFKVDCKAVRTTCDLKDTTSCNDRCNNTEEMMCVNLNEINNTPDLNKGGAGIGVCVPSKPDMECNIENGGSYVWTGYGFSGKQEWTCECNKQNYYSGPSCENKNPEFCANGTINKKLDPTDINACVCDNPNYKKKMQWADTKLPFCASDNKNIEGPISGLYGNITTWPNWINVYVNSNTQDNNKKWANNIANEMFTKQFSQNYVNQIDNILQSTNMPDHLTNNIIDKICNQIIPKNKNIGGYSGICNTRLPESFTPHITYTYYPNAEII